MNDTAVPVDPTNVEQAGEWDGPDGEYWAKYHAEYERLLGVFDDILVEAGQVSAEARCLDLGCGTGATTRALAACAAAGSVLGIDLSGPMLAVARAAAQHEALGNVAFAQGDAQIYRFDPSLFDVAVSRMGCMFFGDPVVAFANVAQALRPGGRLALTVWQAVSDNTWVTAIDSALGESVVDDDEAEATGYEPGPFSLADPELIRSVLQRAGFVDVTVRALQVPLAFGSVDEGQRFLETWMDEDLDPDSRAQASQSLHRLLEENLTADGVLLPSATWLVTASRPTDVQAGVDGT